MAVVPATSRAGLPARSGAGNREVALLVAMLVAGVALRCWIAFTNLGVRYDIGSLYEVAAMLAVHPLHAYVTQRWPYPGGYLPVIALCHWLSDATGAVFYGVIKLPQILADTAIALAVWWAAGRRRLLAAALVALGPSFILISGYHGQIDSTAILPALLGVLVWARWEHRHRALAAGLLIGLGAAVKSVPLFMVLALLPTARGRREVLTLIAAALVPLVVSVLPFLADDFRPTWTALTSNRGIPGWGGISLIAQPRLPDVWLYGDASIRMNSVTRVLWQDQNYIVAAGALAAGAFAYRRRLAPFTAAALTWLAVYAVNPDPAFQYYVWGLPFFLLAGGLAGTAVLQLALVPLWAMLYFRAGLPWLGHVYTPLALLVWAGLLATAVRLAWRHAQPQARPPRR